MAAGAVTPATSGAIRRDYALAAVALELHTSDAATAAALDRRLRGLACPACPDDAVRLEYVGGPSELATLPADRGRPVYETRDGTIHYVAEDDTLWGEIAGVRLRCSAADGIALIASDRLADRALYLAAHPLTTLSLMEMLKRRSRYPLHAGCVAAPSGRGVLIAGPAGSGKSTLTFALARAGLEYLSDDIVFLGHDVGVRAFGFSDAIGVTPATAELFDELRPLSRTPPDPGFPKYLVRPEDALELIPREWCEPVAIVVPSVVADAPSEIAELDPGEAWLRLVPDVLLTERVATQRHLAALAALLAQVRCYRVNSGHDLAEAARLVAELVGG